MLPSFVCYADILGYGQLSQEALKKGEGELFLVKLRKALSYAYERVRTRSIGIEGEQRFSVKVFTDNIVVGYPIHMRNIDHGEPELGHILSIFSEFQAGLAMEGFFLRGGLSYGDHYMDEDIAFGVALLKAVALDKTGGPPRLTLDSSAIEVVRKHLGFYSDVYTAPQYHDLLEDSDGSIFLNYLNEAFFDFPDGGILFDLITAHKNSVVNGLEEYNGCPGVKAKYEWAARYHNFVCRDFVERYRYVERLDVSEEYGSIIEEAKKVLGYLIDIELFAAEPRRLTISPIKERQNGV